MTRVLDVLERSTWTFVQAFSGTLLADGLFERLDLPLSAKLSIAASAAVVAVLKVLSVQTTVKTGEALVQDTFLPPAHGSFPDNPEPEPYVEFVEDEPLPDEDSVGRIG